MPGQAHPRFPLGLPFFYGWVVLAVSMSASFMSGRTSQLFMGIMLKPLSEELSWSRTLVTGAISAGTIASGLLSPLLGVLADRQGPRLLMALGAIVVSIALFALAGLQGLVQFYVS